MPSGNNVRACTGWLTTSASLSHRWTSSGRAGSPSAAAPHAGKALAAHTLPLSRRLRMRVDDTCQAHRCAGRVVGINADHTARSRRAESPRALSGCALRRRAPHRVGRRPRSPATQRRLRRAARSPRPRTRVTRESGKARPQRDGRVGLGTQRGSQTTLRRARFSTRRPREQERDARRRRRGAAGERGRRPTRCGARRRSAQPESARSDSARRLRAV